MRVSRNAVKVPDRYRYSPYEPAHYVSMVDGFRVGPGVAPALSETLAAWNLYWLSFPDLEAHTDLDPDPREHPLFAWNDPMVEPAIETARQSIGGTRVADLVTQLPPCEFIAAIQGRDLGTLAIARRFGADSWLAVMAQRMEINPGGIVASWMARPIQRH
jgi:hypothetical protein